MEAAAEMEVAASVVLSESSAMVMEAAKQRLLQRRWSSSRCGVSCGSDWRTTAATSAEKTLEFFSAEMVRRQRSQRRCKRCIRVGGGGSIVLGIAAVVAAAVDVAAEESLLLEALER